jgi:hypothetical protein
VEAVIGKTLADSGNVRIGDGPVRVMANMEFHQEFGQVTMQYTITTQNCEVM